MESGTIVKSLSWARRSSGNGSFSASVPRLSLRDRAGPQILAGRDVLISRADRVGQDTGGLSRAASIGLVRKALDGTLADRTEVVYVSPLKALGNDIQKNLEGPLAEIVALARRARPRDAGDSHGACAPGDTLMPARGRRCCAARRTSWSRPRSRSTSC